MMQVPKNYVETKVSKIDKYVGNQLKDYRITQGLSQQILAQVAGVSIQQIQKYEKGTNRISSGKLYLFAQFLKMPITSFFKEANSDDHTLDKTLSRDTLAVVQAYNAIKDPIVRTKIVNLLKTMANIPI